MISINLRKVCLDYPLYGAYDFSLKRRLLGGLMREPSELRIIRAVDNISLEATPGARIGLAGPNGSGKSTLLRLIAGVYPPSSGTIEVKGSVVPLLGLNAGVNLDFVEDNIALLLRISGRKPTRAIIDEIWAFTELQERMQRLPLRMFSSGMLMRVLFATATAFPADVLLLDEWLSVVDENFSAKAQTRLLSLVEQAEVVIIASHDQPLLRRTCTRIINLDHRRIASTIAVEPSAAHPFELREKTRMKKNILLVSEALGEPNHKRGIFHFTRELIRSLAADGHELTLSSRPRAATASSVGASGAPSCFLRNRATSSCLLSTASSTGST
ncbi:ABC transporter ATP-binding protein [Bradyrhizobium liaoningense]|uniref:ABC transporter ATP-binding protein n=1 Tax=Bradyrhizobium liaoningense TaxID=43992 RepID=UPI00289F3995|nr:ABC transporter ATP-binding protein [Bradyrhizobium liaoningense]